MGLAKDSVAVVIPARYGSSRYPGKPLVQLGGKPLIQHVYESAAGNPLVADVIVATDHLEIFEVVRNFGGKARLISDSCRTGTDRVGKVAETLEHGILVNLQADEIFFDSELLNQLILPFQNSGAVMGTLMRPLYKREEILDPSVVKIVINSLGQALYFSRSPIPFVRNSGGSDPDKVQYFMHLGIYIFRRETLFQFISLKSGVLEEVEQLEQLRALEAGIPIQVWETTLPSLRIDTPQDLAKAQQSWKQYLSYPNG